MQETIQPPIAHTFDHNDLSTGPLLLDDSFLIPFRDDVWSPPINSVPFEAPPTGPHEIAKINAERTAWEVIPYWVGHVYWLADRSRHEITEAGVVPPDGWLAADPGPSLSDVKTSRIAQITRECEAAIVGGFESSALGQPHMYPCKATDQSNLQASVSVAAQRPNQPFPFWCQAASGEWTYVAHTAAQITQVGMDAYDATLSKLQRKGQLEARINAALSIAEVEAVKWAADEEVAE